MSLVPIARRRVRFTSHEGEATCSCCYDKAEIAVRVEEERAPGSEQSRLSDGPIMKNGAVDVPDVRTFVLICPSCLQQMLNALKRPEDT